MENLPLPGEKYIHYKGGTYEVITLATHTETKEIMVVYRSLNFGSTHVRPLLIWNEKIEVTTFPKNPINRFTKIEQA